MTIGDARFNTVGAIVSACADLAVGSLRLLTPRTLAAQWGGAPATLAGRVGQRWLSVLNQELKDRNCGLKVLGYNRCGKRREFVVHRLCRARPVKVVSRMAKR